MTTPIVRLKRLPHGEGLPLPKYAEDGASGIDIPSAADGVMQPGERVILSTGFAIEIERGYEGQVRPRSGLAATKGVTVLNSPGTIDWSYRGELKVILLNASASPVTIAKGDRVAQLVISPVVRAEIVEVDELSATPRGEGGFGSTGA